MTGRRGGRTELHESKHNGGCGEDLEGSLLDVKLGMEGGGGGINVLTINCA